MENASGFDAQEMLRLTQGLVTTWGLRVIGAIFVLVVGWIAAKAVRGSVRKALSRSEMDETLVPFISSLVYYALLVFVVVAVLNLFGVQTTSIIAVLGAAGFAIGLALQGTLSNFASGVMLLIFRPFTVGHYVEVGGTSGSVVEIGIFATTLNSPDNVRIIVPNSSIYGQTVKNYTANDTRRNDMVVGISYGDDIEKALGVVRSVLRDDPRVLADPEPVIAVGELADSSVNIVVRPWCRGEDYWKLRFDLTRKLKDELEGAGCSIPYPQRDVHLQQPVSAPPV